MLNMRFFLKQYSNERQVKRRNLMLVIQFASIELPMVLKKENYLWSTEIFRRPES